MTIYELRVGIIRFKEERGTINPCRGFVRWVIVVTPTSLPLFGHARECPRELCSIVLGFWPPEVEQTFLIRDRPTPEC